LEQLSGGAVEVADLLSQTLTLATVVAVAVAVATRGSHLQELVELVV
jgi:hypothetical protein